MSQGPVSTKPFKPTKYYNTEVTPKDWCRYMGECPVFLGTYLGDNPCHVCKFKREFNIPKLLEERNKR